MQVTHVAGLARGLAESRQVRRVEAGVAPVRMVENVERLSAELKSGTFRDGELLEQTQVPVKKARLVKKVARAGDVVEGSLGWLAEQQIAARVLGIEPIQVIACAVQGDIMLDLGSPVLDPELAAAIKAAVLADAYEVIA